MSTAPIAMNGICPGVWTGNHITGDSSDSRENASGVLQERITASSHAGSTMVCTRPSRVADTHQPRSSQRTCSVSSGWSSILEGSASLVGSLSISAAGPGTESHANAVMPSCAPVVWTSCAPAGAAAVIPGVGSCSLEPNSGVVVPCTPPAMAGRLPFVPAVMPSFRRPGQVQRFAIISRCSSSCSLDDLSSDDDADWSDEDLHRCITPFTGQARHAGPWSMWGRHASHG